MICNALFLQILPKLQFISTPWSEVHFTYCFPSQKAVGSNSGWCLKFFRVSQPVGGGFDPLLRHTFFCNKRVAENIPVLSGRLVFHNFQSSLTDQDGDFTESGLWFVQVMRSFKNSNNTLIEAKSLLKI